MSLLGQAYTWLDDLANYRGTEYIGKLGIEQSYENELHGQPGFEEVEISAGGHAVRRLKRSTAHPGHTVVPSHRLVPPALVRELFGAPPGLARTRPPGSPMPHAAHAQGPQAPEIAARS